MPDLPGMTLALVLSAILGGLVGYERQTHDHPAGLRTYMLVCVGSTLMTLVSVSFPADQSRIAAQIVSGIGFIGAGTILHRGHVVQGLTTAAGLWVVAGIGMLVAAHGVDSEYAVLAVLATVFVFAVLSILRRLEDRLRLAGGTHELYFEIAAERVDLLSQVLQGLSDMGIAMKSLRTAEAADSGRRSFRIVVVLPKGLRAQSVVEFATAVEGLHSLHWI